MGKIEIKEGEAKHIVGRIRRIETIIGAKSMACLNNNTTLTCCWLASDSDLGNLQLPCLRVEANFTMLTYPKLQPDPQETTAKL